MRTATVRQLRHDFGSVLNWIEEGEQVEIRKRGKPVAVMSAPLPPKRSSSKKRTDFAARLKLRDGAKAIPAGVMQSILEENKGDY